MAYHELFDFLFPVDGLTKILLSQPSHLKWMQALENQLKPILVTKGNILAKLNDRPDHIYYMTKGLSRDHIIEWA